MTAPYVQTFINAFGSSAELEARLRQAQTRLLSTIDVETKSIFAPLLASHNEVTQPVLDAAATLRDKATDLIVVGSGGSGLSGKVFAALNTEPSSVHRVHVVDSCDLHIAQQMMATLSPEKCALLLVSKSGSTVETLVYADLFLRWIERSANTKDRVVVITMHDDNLLHKKAQHEGWLCLAHDPHLCGRFSILSPVGLLPAAFMDMDINALLRGALHAWNSPELAKNAAYFQMYALSNAHAVHVCFAYGARFAPLSQWWRQGLAESLGKGGKGVFPIRAEGTRDQHSQLQLYLDGPAQAIYTLITEESQHQGGLLSHDTLLPFLASHTVGDIIQSQQKATLETLKNAKKSIRHFILNNHDMETVGALLSQWMQEIILLGYMLEVNPFDQPAVEESKRLAREFLSHS